MVAIYIDHTKLTRNMIGLTYICGFCVRMQIDGRHTLL
jgi:hypothetical protein